MKWWLIILLMLLGCAIVVGFSIFIASFRPAAYAWTAGIINFVGSLCVAGTAGPGGVFVFPAAAIVIGLICLLIAWYFNPAG